MTFIVQLRFFCLKLASQTSQLQIKRGLASDRNITFENFSLILLLSNSFCQSAVLCQKVPRIGLKSTFEHQKPSGNIRDLEQNDAWMF